MPAPTNNPTAGMTAEELAADVEENGPQIEVDGSVDGSANSDYSSDGTASKTTSLSQTINEYFEENGLRYHTYYGKDKMIMPTDDSEANRMDIHHESMRLLKEDRIYDSPLDTINPQRCLDVGTGSGIWAIDFADLHPECEVIGVDISPIQPKWVPSNCKFEIDDVELEWTYPENHFDFIHLRNLAQSINDWPLLLKRAVACLKPGGYLEISDMGTQSYDDHVPILPTEEVGIFFDKLNEAVDKMGRPQASLARMKELISGCGLEDIVTIVQKQPMAPWPKDKRLKQIGAMVSLAAEEGGFEAYGMAAFTRILGMSGEEAKHLCNEAHRQLVQRHRRLYLKQFTAYGRKVCDPEM